jgi:hypothetical protein
MAFEKGKSGNPGGRPKVALEIRELAQENSPRALRKLAALIDSEDERVAMSAAEAILDRAIGKPIQATAQVDSEGNDIAQVEMTKNELVRRIVYLFNDAIKRQNAPDVQVTVQ